MHGSDLCYAPAMTELTEDQYPALRPYLPVQRGNVLISNLTIINAIIHVAETGCKWRALPERFGKWYTVYTRMRRWADAGVLDRLFEGLQKHYQIDIRIEALGLDRIAPKKPLTVVKPRKKRDRKSSTKRTSSRRRSRPRIRV